MGAALIVLFFVAPLAELALLLAAGRSFGVVATIGACAATAILGGLILRRQGLKALAAAQSDLASGRMPVGAAVDAAFLAMAAPLLMTPGFLTDAMGFLMLVPAIRRGLARRALATWRRRIAGED